MSKKHPQNPLAWVRWGAVSGIGFRAKGRGKGTCSVKPMTTAETSAAVEPFDTSAKHQLEGRVNNKVAKLH